MNIFMVLIFGSFLLPSKVVIEREIQINASVDSVYQQVIILPNWESWMPWTEKDSTIVTK